MATCHEVKRFSPAANAAKESMGSSGQQHVHVCQFWLSMLALVCRGLYPFFLLFALVRPRFCMWGSKKAHFPLAVPK